MNWWTPARSNAGWRLSLSRRGSCCCQAWITSFTAGINELRKVVLEWLDSTQVDE